MYMCVYIYIYIYIREATTNTQCEKWMSAPYAGRAQQCRPSVGAIRSFSQNPPASEEANSHIPSPIPSLAIQVPWLPVGLGCFAHGSPPYFVTFILHHAMICAPHTSATTKLDALLR